MWCYPYHAVFWAVFDAGGLGFGVGDEVGECWIFFEHRDFTKITKTTQTAVVNGAFDDGDGGGDVRGNCQNSQIIFF